MAIIVGSGEYRYRIVEDWARLPDGWSFKEVGAVGVDAKDNVYVFNRGEHPMMVFDRTGKFLRSWGEGQYPRAHGVHMGPDESIYLTDDGGHFVRKCRLEDGKVLLELGVPPYLLNATLNGVMGQRLVRTLCEHCKQKIELNRAEDQAAWEALVMPWKSKHPAKLYKPVGCLECRMTGFTGRIGIYETLLFTGPIKALVNDKADLSALREQAFKEGMKPLRISGAMKVGAGLTTIEEVLKVAPPVRDSNS